MLALIALVELRYLLTSSTQKQLPLAVKLSNQ
jgi:hypothetical protein